MAWKGSICCSSTPKEVRLNPERADLRELPQHHTRKTRLSADHPQIILFFRADLPELPQQHTWKTRLSADHQQII